jgi:hypothetical protein
MSSLRARRNAALFSELAQQKGRVAPLRFVNIRETGGWGAQRKNALPKMAALLAAAALPDPEPVPVVDYRSAGHVLIVGPQIAHCRGRNGWQRNLTSAFC